MARTLGILKVDAEFLTTLLRLPEGTVVLDARFEDPGILSLKINGPGLPVVAEGERVPTVAAHYERIYERITDEGCASFIRYEPEP